MTRSASPPPTLIAAALALAASSMACNRTPRATAEEPAPPSASVPPSTAAATPVERPPAPGGVPVLVAETFAPATRVYPVEGALMTVEGQRVGRIVDKGVEWLKEKIPKGSPAVGDNIITRVQGRWPDAIDVLYTSSNGRAQMPTYFPLTGKGASHTAAPGGGLGDIIGVARVGESTVVAAWDLGDGMRIVHVRGPAIARTPMSSADAGCKPGEVYGALPDRDAAAMHPLAIEGTPDGTLVSIGRLCDRRGPVAEVWDRTGKSRMIDLAARLKSVSGTLLRGAGDELWLFAHSWRPLLHFQKGAFDLLPRLERPTRAVFVTPKGRLFASDGLTIHLFADGSWKPFGRLPTSAEFRVVAIDDDVIWATAGGSVHKLRPGPETAPTDECTTPFVYLYDAGPKNDDKFTYPSTRKALSTFAGASEIELVEIKDENARRLGIRVKSKAQGEAVVAHLKDTMKDEDPQLYCYEPKSVRKIDL